MDEQLVPPQPVVQSPLALTKAKACTSCRQQKLKCDASRNPSQACSRCAAAGVSCYFSDVFQRKKARRYSIGTSLQVSLPLNIKSKAEMQREIIMLRNMLSNSRNETATKLSPSEQEVPLIGLQSNAITSSEMHSHESLPDIQTMSMPSDIQFNTFEASTSSIPNVSAQSIDGICIEDFKHAPFLTTTRFFKHYHPMLPILEPSWDPDSFYKLSPLIFWCVLITGSRRYELDPTILDRLSSNVRSLALRSLSQVTVYFPTICGLLILSTWPLPMKTMWDDPSIMYSGAAMQLALQNGLNLFIKSHASSRPAIYRNTAAEPSLARVWAYLEFVCHCTCWTSGLPPYHSTDSFDLSPYDEEIAKCLSPNVIWMQEFEKLSARAMRTLTELIYTRDSGGSMDSLSSVIKVFDEQIFNFSQKTSEDMRSKMPQPIDGPRPLLPNPLIILMSRININTFHFFGPDVSAHLPNLIELYHTACHWTQQASEMDEVSGWARYSSESYFRSMILVGVIILRISHSHLLKPKIDQRKGEKAYFTIVKLIKKRSLHTRDVNAHTAIVLSELWHNDYCFRQPDGTHDSLKVRVSGRGAMGVAFDCLWADRRSFQPPNSSEMNMHTQPANDLPALQQSNDLSMSDNNMIDVPLMDESGFSDLVTDTSLNFLSNSIQWIENEWCWI